MSRRLPLPVRLPLLCGLAAALWAAAAVAAAPKSCVPRVGHHDSFTRLVFDVPASLRETVTQQGNILILHLPGLGNVTPKPVVPPGLAAFTGGQDAATLTLADGTNPKIWHGAGRVVVDLYFGRLAQHAGAKLPDTQPSPAHSPPPIGPDQAVTARPHLPEPAPEKPLEIKLVAMPDAAGAPKPPPLPPALAAAGAGLMLPGPPQTPAQPLPATPAGPVRVQAVAAPQAELAGEQAQAPATNGLLVTRLPTAPAGTDAALLLPFDPGVGAAAFSRGGRAHVVFDESKPLDLAALKDDPLFAGALVHLQPASTEMSLKLPPGSTLVLRRRAEGWEIDVATGLRHPDSASLTLKNGTISIAMPGAADCVVLTDPATGARLLVGTVHDAGPGIAVSHVSPEFHLQPSWAGVVVEAVSDRLDLRADKSGFALLAANGPGLATALGGPAEQAMAEAGTLTRQFDLAPLPIPVLLTRLENTLAAAGAAPKLARFGLRLHAAEDMLALGLGREAAGVIRAALQDDPTQAMNARANALLAAAEFLAGTQAAPDPGAPPRPTLSGSDEAALWHAIIAPDTPSPTQTAATLATTWRLLLAYPQPLRDRLLPIVADALLQGGQTDAVHALLAKVADPALDLVRARALRQEGKTKEALALLDQLEAGSDRRQSALALRDAVEIRLAAGEITAAQAAQALEHHLYAWRDDRIEPDTRLRVAALQAKAGKWRESLALLRESDTAFPTRHAEFRAAERDCIASLLHADAGAAMAPLDLVALVEESADILAEKEANDSLAPVLVDKLLALDLPERAEPILAKLMARTAEPVPRARLGLRLAALALERHDMDAAAADLESSNAAELPADLAATRDVLRARILAAGGKPQAALDMLARLQTAEALELRARLYELGHDWAGAETALQALADTTLPAQGALSTAQQELVLRLASAASQAGDMAAMQRLRGGAAARLDAGPRQDLFRALAAQPISTTTDLPRSASEAESARAVPAALASFEPH